MVRAVAAKTWRAIGRRPRGTGAATATIRCGRARTPSTSHSQPSRRGSCASPATAATRSDQAPVRVCRASRSGGASRQSPVATRL